jgi:hypothetical protein
MRGWLYCITDGISRKSLRILRETYFSRSIIRNYANADDVSCRFYLSARRVREGVKDRIDNGDEGRALTLIPDHKTS